MAIEQIKSISYQTHKILKDQDVTIPRSHLLELIAALLGYNTYAALCEDESNSQLEDHQLEDAEIIILNNPKAKIRADNLGIRFDIMELCSNQVKEQFRQDIFDSVEDFYDLHACPYLEEITLDSALDAAASSNACFPNYPELEQKFEASGDLWKSRSQWSIESKGTLTGEYDENKNRPYTGHLVMVWGKLIYTKVGRSGLILLDEETGVTLDDSWRWDEFESID